MLHGLQAPAIGHSLRLQASINCEAPEQFFPANSGAGELHSLESVLVPFPHVVLQGVFVQSLHIPSIALSFSQTKLLIEFSQVLGEQYNLL